MTGDALFTPELLNEINLAPKVVMSTMHALSAAGMLGAASGQ